MDGTARHIWSGPIDGMAPISSSCYAVPANVLCLWPRQSSTRVGPFWVGPMANCARRTHVAVAASIGIVIYM
jgi:hypothetical protein